MEVKKAELQTKFDELDALEVPTEEQLVELEKVESELLEVTEQLEAIFGETTEEIVEEDNKLPDNEVPKNYKVPDGEKHLVHAAIRIGSRFDPETGKQTAEVFTQVYNPTDFKNVVNNASRLGIKYAVLHEPKK